MRQALIQQRNVSAEEEQVQAAEYIVNRRDGDVTVRQARLHECRRLFRVTSLQKAMRLHRERRHGQHQPWTTTCSSVACVLARHIMVYRMQFIVCCCGVVSSAVSTSCEKWRVEQTKQSQSNKTISITRQKRGPPRGHIRQEEQTTKQNKTKQKSKQNNKSKQSPSPPSSSRRIGRSKDKKLRVSVEERPSVLSLSKYMMRCRFFRFFVSSSLFFSFFPTDSHVPVFYEFHVGKRRAAVDEDG